MTMSHVLKATLLHGLALALAMAVAMEARAAVSPHANSNGGIQATKEALDLSMLERIQALKSDSNSYSNLKALMESKSEAFELRYKATTALAKVAGSKAKTEMVHAMTSSEWFLRNAGLIGMSSLDRAEALVWARKLLNDKALVVRSAAVDIITQARDTTSTNLLWQKLYSKENFRNKQSLYIRRRIVEALSEIDSKEHAAKFVALLQDKDDSLHEPAMEALERITHQAVATPGSPLQDRRAQWQKWYKANKATL
jgi:HEAT repeat protein